MLRLSTAGDSTNTYIKAAKCLQDRALLSFYDW